MLPLPRRVEPHVMNSDPIVLKEEALDRRFRHWLQRLTFRAWTSRDAVLQSGLDAAMAVASGDLANIQLLHPNGRALELKAQRGFQDEFLDFFALVDDASSACGVAMKERRAIEVADVASSPIFAGTRGREVMLAQGSRAVVSVPLTGRGGLLLGMVSVHYREPGARSEADLARFQMLGSVIGACIEGTSGR